ncbi:MAG: EAL domain-containing protein [Motiliproteus sp.]
MSQQHTRLLKQSFVISLLLLLGSLIAGGGYTLWRLHSGSLDAAAERSTMHARSFESYLTQNLLVVEMLASGIHANHTGTLNPLSIQNEFISVLKHAPFLRSISLLDQDSIIIASSSPTNIGLSINTQSHIPADPKASGLLRIGNPWAGRTLSKGRPTTPQTPVINEFQSFIPMSYSFTLNEQRFQLLATLNPDYFINHISQQFPVTEGSVEILRYDGTLLLSNDPLQQAGAVLEFVKRDLKPEQIEAGQSTRYKRHGRPVLTAFRASRLYPFIVVNHLDKEHATTNWLAERSTLIWVFLLMMLVLSFVASFFFRYQMQLAKKLARSQRIEEINATAFSTSTEAVIITDTEASILSTNPALSSMTGYSQEQLIGQNPRIFASGEQSPQFYHLMWQQLMHEGVWQGEFTNKRRDGSHYDTRGTVSAYRDEEGDIKHFIGVFTDITEQKKNEAQLRQAASVFMNSQEGILITDGNNCIVDVNPAFTHITGYSFSEAIGKSPNILSSDRHSSDFFKQMWQSLSENGSWQGEVWNRRRSGEVFPERLSINAMQGEDGKITQYVAVFSDISRFKEHEAALHRIAHFDPLTGIPNRRLLGERLELAISRANRSRHAFALCYLDLDGFKPVNDQHGHATGDCLLVELTQRLLGMLRPDDTLARLGGDEFVLLLTELADPQDIHITLERILSSISRPVLINDKRLRVTASVGVAMYSNESSEDADSLLRKADQAMYQAKDRGKNGYHLYDPEQDRMLREQRSQLERLRSALQQQEFVLYFQPKVDLRDGTVVGAEALIRWQHPQRGILPPGDFLGIINGSDLEVDLGEWVIETALRQIEHWKVQGIDLPISVNLSADHLLHDTFIKRLRCLLQQYPQVNPGDFELEILETATISNMDHAVEVLTQCHDLGVALSLDDFGTGYSSLTYFQRLPVDTLKIDQSFIRDMLDDSSDLGIVDSVVRLAQAFDRKVIAEGVESAEHGAALLQVGCFLAQGYGIARPMPAKKLPDWIKQWHSNPIPALAMAKLSHRNWVEQFIRYTDTPDQCEHPNLDSQRSDFGRWYYGSAKLAYQSLPAYQQAGYCYQQSHSCAQSLVSLMKQNEFEGAAQRLINLQQLQQQLFDAIDALNRP